MKTVLPNARFTLAERLLKAEEPKINRALEALNQAMQSSFDAVWNNLRITPEEAFSAQGTKAKGNTEDHAQTVVYLIQMGVDVPQKYRAAPRPYTTHEDGTITLD